MLLFHISFFLGDGISTMFLLCAMQQFIIELMWNVNFLLFLIRFFHLALFHFIFIIVKINRTCVLAQVHAERSFPCFCLRNEWELRNSNVSMYFISLLFKRKRDSYGNVLLTAWCAAYKVNISVNHFECVAQFCRQWSMKNSKKNRRYRWEKDKNKTEWLR